MNRRITLFMATCLTSLLFPQPTIGQPLSSTSEQDERLMEGVRLTPRAFRHAAKKIASALVTIESFGGSSTAAGKIGGIRQQGEGNTTGVVITPDGYVVTSSFNFIEQPSTITVLTSDGVRRVAELKGRDDTRRICLLKISGVSDLPVPDFVSPEDVRVGQWAISVGLGYGDSNPAISMGIISALNRVGGRAIQTDANISPANYGGPLLDIEGRVIGICVPMSANSQSLASGVEWYDSGIGFCVPIVGNEDLIEQMKKGRHIKRAFLGIETEDIDGQGIRITRVLPGTAASKADLKTGDVVFKLNHQAIANIAELRTALEKYYAGDKVEVSFRRGDKQHDTMVELGEPIRQDVEDTPALFPGRRRSDQEE